MRNELDNNLYNMIFKRKSFHLFRNTGNEIITVKELNIIKEKYSNFKPLDNNIKTDIQIVKADKTTCVRGEEYCILLYSENKNNYLQNIGYIGEQLDLFLVSMNIGTLWFGIGKTDNKKYNNLDFVIMIAIKKVDESCFRKDMFKSKRKNIEEIWNTNKYIEIANIVRFAPSSCNTQPWIVEEKDPYLNVYRYKKEGKRGIMPSNMVTYYNKIDVGIYLCFLELCLNKNNIDYDRILFIDNKLDNTPKILFAKYEIKKK